MNSMTDLLPFIREIDRLKQVERQTVIHSGGRRENTAEHSWHLALTVLVLQNQAPSGTDLGRAVQMALLHDLVEIDAGDTFAYADATGKKEKELRAFERLMSLLPESLAESFRSLWLEFEAGESPAARYVNAIDRFLPIYANSLNDGYSWKNHGVTFDRVIARNQAAIEGGIPELWRATEDLLAVAVREGHLAEKNS